MINDDGSIKGSRHDCIIYILLTVRSAVGLPSDSVEEDKT